MSDVPDDDYVPRYTRRDGILFRAASLTIRGYQKHSENLEAIVQEAGDILGDIVQASDTRDHDLWKSAMGRARRFVRQEPT